MRVGDYVKVEEIKNQSACRWVVLADLAFDSDCDLVGGVVQYIEDTKRAAGEKQLELSFKDIDTTLICGALEPLNVGGVFVE